MPATNRPIGDAQHRTHWGAPKRCRSLSLSDECWEILTTIADAHDCNRSEVVERLTRQAMNPESPLADPALTSALDNALAQPA